MRKLFAALLGALILGLHATCLANIMPQSEMCFGVFDYSKTLGTALDLLGAPVQREVVDAGYFRTVVYHFATMDCAATVPSDDPRPERDYNLTCIRLTSELASTRSGFLATPSGFAVGTPYFEVRKMFGMGEAVPGQNGMTVYVYMQEGNPGRFMEFVVDEKAVVREIALTQEI